MSPLPPANRKDLERKQRFSTISKFAECWLAGWLAFIDADLGEWLKV